MTEPTNELTIPHSIKDGLHRYREDHCQTGDFLYAVLSNDLMGAMGRADVDNRVALFEICTYIWNYLPGACWGSKEKVDRWLGERDTG